MDQDIAVRQMKTTADEIASLSLQINGASPSGIETLVEKINDQVERLKAAADELVAMLAPAPVEQPAPVAKVEPVAQPQAAPLG